MSRGLDRGREDDTRREAARPSSTPTGRGNSSGKPDPTEALRSEDQPSRGGASANAKEQPDRAKTPAPEKVSRESRSVGTLHPTESEMRTLGDIGRFRTVAVIDLAKHLYARSDAPFKKDLASLVAMGLVQRRTAVTDQGRSLLRVAVLTKAGRDLVKRAGLFPNDQAIYAGFVKPAEVAHDAAIYRMFQQESRQLEAAGNRIRRVVLDFELKKRVYSPLAKARHLPETEYARRKEEIARDNGLKVVDGKIPLPDLRIEYESPNGEVGRVDLELATHHYNTDQMGLKEQAGFKIYAADGGAAGHSVIEEREITASILSL